MTDPKEPTTDETTEQPEVPAVDDHTAPHDPGPVPEPTPTPPITPPPPLVAPEPFVLEYKMTNYYGDHSGRLLFSTLDAAREGLEAMRKQLGVMDSAEATIRREGATLVRASKGYLRGWHLHEEGAR